MGSGSAAALAGQPQLQPVDGQPDASAFEQPVGRGQTQVLGRIDRHRRRQQAPTIAVQPKPHATAKARLGITDPQGPAFQRSGDRRDHPRADAQDHRVCRQEDIGPEPRAGDDRHIRL